MQQQGLRGLAIISIAIFVGGIVFISLGISMFNKATNFSETAEQDYLDNKTSGVRSIIDKMLTDVASSTINALTHVSKGITTSIAAFLCLVGIGICVIAVGLFKGKYLAWIITVVLMFVAIVIDVLGLGFVGGTFPTSSDDKGIMSTDFAYLFIGIMISHLLANALIIYYLTKKSTASRFKTL